MIKKIVLSFVFTCVLITIGKSQCINTTQYPPSTVYISSCSTGTITNCNWALEYSDLMFNITGNFVFHSSIPTDYLTLTTSANVVIASGTQPLIVNIPTAGGYRLHVSADAFCGTDQTCRVTSYDCAQPCSGVPNPGFVFINSPYNSVCTPTIVAFGLWGSTSALGLSYQWQWSLDGTNWTSTIGATAPNYTQTINATTYVRCIVACGTNTAVANFATVTFGGTPLSYTTVEDNSYVCAGSYVNFSLTGNSLTPGMTYQWQSSNNGTSGWSNISGQTGSTMLKQVNATKYDRCLLTCGTNTAVSSSILVTVAGAPTGGNAVASSAAPCGGGSVTYSLSGSSADYGTAYQWQSSSNGTSWTDLVGQTLSTTTQNVISSTYFRCVLSCGTNTAASMPVLTVISTGGVSYATPPYYQTFDNTWQNACDTRDVPDNLYWKANPASGDNSWRRQDDGASAFWGNSTWGIVSPQSGVGCANFHSSWGANNSKGSLDFYVNMSQNGKYALSFYYMNATGSDNLDVLLSTDAGTSYSIKGSYATQPAWTKKTIYFNSPNSSSCIIRLRGTADNGNDDLGIDSLSLKLVCLNPSINAVSSETNICLGQSVTLTATGATNYTWSPTGLHTATIVVTPTINTHYVVTGSNDGLCFPTAAVSVSVVACNGIEELYGTNISLYPNPTSDIVMITMPAPAFTTYLEITDAFGKLVFKEILKQEKNSLNIQELASGLYFYKVLQNGVNIAVGKLLKQ